MVPELDKRQRFGVPHTYDANDKCPVSFMRHGPRRELRRLRCVSRAVDYDGLLFLAYRKDLRTAFLPVFTRLTTEGPGLSS